MSYAVYQDIGPCPCGEQACTVVGTKLSRPLDRETPSHLVGCNCIRHRGKRNRDKGRRAQGRGYRRLGGKAPWTPGHEESQEVLSVEVAVEAKAGRQIPASFTKAFGLEWTRRALSQAERAIPEGVQASPAIYMEPKGGGAWLIVKLS